MHVDIEPKIMLSQMQRARVRNRKGEDEMEKKKNRQKVGRGIIIQKRGILKK